MTYHRLTPKRELPRKCDCTGDMNFDCEFPCLWCVWRWTSLVGGVWRIWLAAGLGAFLAELPSPSSNRHRQNLRVHSLGFFLYEVRHSTLQHRYGLARRNGRIHGHSRHTGIETKELQQLCPGQAAMR